MASPANRYHMKVNGFLSHSSVNANVMRLYPIGSATPTGLLMNPVQICFLTYHSTHLIIPSIGVQPIHK